MMKGEMNAKLKHKTYPVQVVLNKKKRKLKKQWWNEQLPDLQSSSLFHHSIYLCFIYFP